jgi:hypothetical protein
MVGEQPRIQLERIGSPLGKDKAVQAACQQLELQQAEEGTFKLFSGQATGELRKAIMEACRH